MKKTLSLCFESNVPEQTAGRIQYAFDVFCKYYGITQHKSASSTIRVDSDNVDNIRKAIVTLRDNTLLKERMVKAALERSKHFDVNDRAKRILNFMEDHSL